MKAHVGDQLVVECPGTGAVRLDGKVVGLHHADGTPPYDVRWAETDQVWVFFPGSDTRVRHLDCPAGPVPPSAAAAPDAVGRGG
ncbi:DUF1918 domain-containing protein [Streptomyces rhizoryzae]|uniref:DUF1918 domain-containing protein n=1 Tax=Streptomyces rhizoryzae TaxID=2932493 RepID=UPI0027E49842|nr:DUF1918 domain-containing protein [Streptomyces rhizoryzae]